METASAVVVGRVMLVEMLHAVCRCIYLLAAQRQLKIVSKSMRSRGTQLLLLLLDGVIKVWNVS